MPKKSTKRLNAEEAAKEEADAFLHRGGAPGTKRKTRASTKVASPKVSLFLFRFFVVYFFFEDYESRRGKF